MSTTGYINIPAFGDPHWKEPVLNVAALPATGNSVGDARVVETPTPSIYIWNGSAWVQATGGVTGTVTSVGLADGSTTPIFTITGSPVTTSGTLTETLNTQNANTVFAGPASGVAAQPTFRDLVSADIPTSLPNLVGIGTITTGIWNGTVTAGNAIIASGTTYTTPANITTATLFHFIVIGAGGGGGGVNSANVGAVGGGGGCVGHVWLTGLSPSTAYTYSIGAGGAGGANTGSTAGSTGGATAITINGVTYTAGAGGGAAAISANTNGPAGGLGTNFQIELIGGNGGASTNSLAGLPSGKGGDACGWGIGGSPICVSGNGINGRGFGGGGSGAHGTGAGGSGSQGGIIIEWNN